jgi:hypothetical protein
MEAARSDKECHVQRADVSRRQFILGTATGVLSGRGVARNRPI